MERSRCKNIEKYREAERLSQKKRRELIRGKIIAIKQKDGCVDCGEKHPACLQFHHVDPATKVKGVRQMISEGYALSAVMLEIGKCIVVCANCHAKKHWAERNVS